MFRRTAGAGLVILALCLVFSCAGKSPAPLFRPDPPRDPALVVGTLDNGFSYLLMENATPKNRVSVHLNVFAGSVHETDAEQGVAHYLEHMLFNGSEHFKPGELVKYFQSIGMDFGADANARTSFFNTVYDLSLPGGDEKYLRDAFTVIQDYARGALLLPEEVDRERGIILAEKRERDSVGYRTFKREMAFEMPGSKLNRRLPIGTDQVIESADRALLKGFYDRWYRPDNMALVVVGDMDTQKTETLIKTYFSGFKPRAPKPLPALDISWEPHEGVQSFYLHEPEAGSTEITIERLTHGPFEPESIDRIKRRVVRQIGDRMLQQRLGRMVRAQAADFTRAQAYSGTYLRHVTAAAVRAECEPGKWKSSLSQLEQALRQAIDHGFTDTELEQARAEYLSELNAAVAGAATRKSRHLATSLLSALNREGMFLSPVQEQTIFSPFIKSIDIGQVNQAFRDSWQADHRLVLVTGNAEIPGSDEQALAEINQAYRKSRAVAVLPYRHFSAKAFPYLTPPEKPGQIINDRQNVKGLGIRQVDLDNHVRINLKPTDFTKGKFAFSLVFGTGTWGAPDACPGISNLAETMVRNSGFGAMDLDQISQALAGKEVDIRFTIRDTELVLEGTAPPDEARLVFELLYTYLVDPGFRAEGLDLAKKRYRQAFDGLKRTPDGIARIKGSRFLAKGDPRFGMADPDQVDAITLEQVKTWLEPQFRSSALELSIVGDFHPQVMVDLGVSFLGGMKGRQPVREIVGKTGIDFPKGEKRTYTLDTKMDKGMVRVSFMTDDYWDIQKTRSLSLLARVLSERLRQTVRERLGVSYSPYVYNMPSMIFKGYGVMHAVVKLAPGDEDIVCEAVETIVADLVSSGISEDELDRVKKPVMNHLSDLRQQNSYWLNSVMAGSLRRPERLDWATTILDGYAGISKEALSGLARKYLNIKDRALIIVQPMKE